MNVIQAIAGIGFAGFGAMLLVRYLVDLVYAFSSREWPRTYGVILSSKVMTTHGSESDTHKPVVTYRFSAGGPEIIGDQVCFGSKDVGWSGGWAKRVVARYPVGATVSVHHDPEDPKTAVLEPGVRPILIGNILISLTFFVVGIYTLV